MPETRIIETVYGVGGYDSTKPNNNIIEQKTAEISDEQLADETEAKKITIGKVATAIDNNFTASQAKILKMIFGRLIKKGLLP